MTPLQDGCVVIEGDRASIEDANLRLQANIDA
jgi:hypothetical protein